MVASCSVLYFYSKQTNIYIIFLSYISIASLFCVVVHASATRGSLVNRSFYICRAIKDYFHQFREIIKIKT